MPTTRRRLRALAAGVGACVLACGYGFAAGPGLATLAKDRPVSVGRFENRSAEADAGLSASRLAARQLSTRGFAGSGGLALNGFVDAVSAFPVGVVGPQDVQLWRAEVRLRLELRASASPDAPLVARSAVVESEDYRSATDVEATEVSRRLAVGRALERAVSDGLDRLASP